MKKVILIVALAVITISTILVGGCYEREQAPMSNLPVLDNSLSSGKYTVEGSIPGEEFIFYREYSTAYNAKLWRITDPKSLTMKAWAQHLPAGAVVLVEHVHIDISLKSRYAALDGWPQDSMDDSVHGGLQPGFWITDIYPYENVFAIEGFSKTLIDGYGYFCGYYGYATASETRLTEDNLVKYGKVYGNKIQVVYDLLIKYPGEDYFHTRSLIDEFLVPTAVQPTDELINPKEDK